jgi:hypothetical protein
MANSGTLVVLTVPLEIMIFANYDKDGPILNKNYYFLPAPIFAVLDSIIVY